MAHHASRIEELYHRALHLYQQSPPPAEAAQLHQQLRREAPGGIYDTILTGLAAAADGRFEEALASYDRALEQGCDPHKALYVLKSLAQARLGRHGEALATCDAGIALAPGNLPLYEYKMVLLLDMGRLAETLTVYDDIQKVRPQAAEILLFKSLALLLLERGEQASGALARLVATLPDATRFPLFRGNMRAHLEQYQSRVEQYLSEHRDSPAAWYCAGLIRLLVASADGSPDAGGNGAFEAFVQALRLDPDDAWALHGMGVAHMGGGKYQKAAEAFARASARAPDVSAFTIARDRAARAAEGSVSPIPTAVARGGAGKQQRRKRTSRRFGPGEIPPQALLEQLLSEGRDEEALEAVEQLISLAGQGRGDVNLEGALWLRARLLLDLERPSEAVAVYHQLLQRDPWRLAAWIELGDVLVFQGRFEESLAALDGALACASGDGSLYRKKAAMLALLGRHAEALQALEQARRLEPAALDLVAMLETSSLNALGRFEEALRRSEEALRSLSRRARALPLVLMNRGDALLALGHAQEALTTYEEALQLETGHRGRPVEEDDALYEGTLFPQMVGDVRSLLLGGLGNAWLVLGEGARALEFYDRALALGPSRALEANREQALAFLHTSSAAGRPPTMREGSGPPAAASPRHPVPRGGVGRLSCCSSHPRSASSKRSRSWRSPPSLWRWWGRPSPASTWGPGCESGRLGCWSRARASSALSTSSAAGSGGTAFPDSSRSPDPSRDGIPPCIARGAPSRVGERTCSSPCSCFRRARTHRPASTRRTISHQPSSSAPVPCW